MWKVDVHAGGGEGVVRKELRGWNRGRGKDGGRRGGWAGKGRREERDMNRTRVKRVSDSNIIIFFDII